MCLLPARLCLLYKTFPHSLPRLYVSKGKEEQKDMEIDFGKVGKSQTAFLRYYMADAPLSGSGVVYSNKEYGKWFHAGQRVVLEMRDPVNPGQRLVVIKNRGKLYSSLQGVRGPFGYQIEVQGEVEVIGRVEDSFDMYEAKVTQSFNPITQGALVLNRSLIQFDYHKTDMNGSAEAQIIGMPTLYAQSEKKVASPYSLVYLNRGAGSGLSVGQMYQVRANSSVRDYIKYGYEIKVGELKVIYTEDRFATGIITGMNEIIHVGDYIVALNKGLIRQSGYDPLDEDLDVEEEMGMDELDSSSEEKSSAPEEPDFEDEDVV